MASIDKVDAGWRARWRTPAGESRSRAFPKKAAAERHLTSVEHSKLTGGYVDPAAGKMTVGEYANIWAASQVWRPSTQVRVDGILRNHLVPMPGSRPLSSVRPSEVQALVRSLTDTLAPGTVKGVFGTLASVYRSAVRDRLVTFSPSEGTSLPRQTQRLVEPLTLEMVEVLADTIGERYRPLVILGAGAGLRVGEALGLAAGHIDFLRRSLSVSQQAVTVRRVTTLAAPKTPASVRTVPLAMRYWRSWRTTSRVTRASRRTYWSRTPKASQSRRTGSANTGRGRLRAPAYRVGFASTIFATRTPRR